MNTTKLLPVGLLVIGLLQTAARGEWQRDDKSLAWISGTNAFWRFSFDPGRGKPFFHPLAPGGNTPLTNFRPADHPWHYALWFSWKYLNHPNDARRVNYWEENSAGNAQGKTRWNPPTIETQTDGRATIRLQLRYVNPSGETDLTELRELQVSAPAGDGGFAIDWLARFTVGDQDLVLDRTPMPGEAGGAVNGGYAGLSARMVPLPVTMSVVTTAGPVERFVSNRARPKAAAIACNFSDGARDIGGLAFFCDPANTDGDAAWYIIDSRQMPFVCQALLAPKPRSVPAHGEFTLRYRIGVSAKAWTQAGLEAGQKEWPASPGLSPAATKHWTADNGNGTYSNPLFYEEFEDPDVIRVGDDYYLAGTTMHMNPAVQIMHSRDLVNWELAGYCMDRLDLGPAFRLEGGSIYGRGIWAPCIRYHNGMFYIFSNVNGVGLQVFRSRSIKGPWERNQLPGRHDLSVLFDDDGKVYIISGGGSPYPIEELAPDLKSFVPGVRHQLVGRMGEGHHLYKIKGKYVDVSAIPGGPVDQMVAVSDSIAGPWKIERMVQGESLGVTAAAPLRAQPNDRGLWLHQGGMVDTPSGEWWSIIMSDHGSAGRMVALVPITWDNGFPLIGLPGNLRKAPNTWVKPNTGFAQEPKPAFIHDDHFDGPKLNAHWQWNHVPDDTKWSLTEKPGVLRLHSLPANNFYAARNSLCQRPPGPESIMTAELDVSGLAAGDIAGLALLSSPYAWIGVAKTADGTTLQMLDNTGSGGGRRGPPGARPSAPPAPATMAPTVGSTPPPNHLWLRVACNFDQDEAVFSWSADGRQFTPLGKPFTMTFQLRTFQGVRPALFNFNTNGQPGGYADFDNYTVEEPRARGIEREIPMGQTITLTSGADGSVLSADTRSNLLVNVAAETAAAAVPNTRFQVMDLGKGRVALKAANGRFVSAADEVVVLKDLAGRNPGEAESFQWINLMRGDTLLMSLANHRYLGTKPNEPGPVTVTATGPRPARKGGECFKWTKVEKVY